MTSGSLDLRSLVEQLTAFPDRRPGSQGNASAVDLVAGVLTDLGWAVETPQFDVIAWNGGEGTIRLEGQAVPVVPSPYGTGVVGRGPLVSVRSMEELESLGGAGHGSVLLLRPPLTEQQLTPAAFPFFDVPDHDRIRAALVAAQPLALVCVTGRNAPLCGAVEPFPFIEDGEFPVPAADTLPEHEERLAGWVGCDVDVEFAASRWGAVARNVVATRGPHGPRVVVTAHVDTKPGTPGALDNAAGVVTLAQLAAVLDPHVPAELVFFNGEDYFSAAGEVDWLARSEAGGWSLDDVLLAINVDAAGFAGDDVAWSAYNIDEATLAAFAAALDRPGIVPGPQWWQSDHAIFAMRGLPALAFTSTRIQELLETIVHSAEDTSAAVDVRALDRLAHAISDVSAMTTGAARPARPMPG